MANMKKSTQVGLLVAALAAGALAAAATRSASKSQGQKRTSTAIPELAAAAPASDASEVQGTVLEVIQVPRYTYLRIGLQGQQGEWAAVPSDKGIKVGDPAKVVQAQAMQDFQSSVLNRKFDRIYFGVLEGRDGQGGPVAGANPHAGMDMAANPHAMANAGDSTGPAVNPGETNPHAQSPASANSIPIGKVAKAKGALGHTVAELYAARASLAGKNVRVRAVVVKSVPGVMGKTFLHVRDGSGSEKAANFDLAITTEAQPQVGETLLFEGKLGADVDFGAGYKYTVIVQDAQLVAD